jgi:hypothetical protein
LTIPRRFIRSVPERTSPDVEAWWAGFEAIHPDWEMVTYRDPIDPSAFPLTGHAWPACRHPAQMAGLLRLEALYLQGGIWVDSDVECYRSFEPLRSVPCFVAWEDHRTVPDAIIGAEAGHAAIKACLDQATRAVLAGEDPWHSGPGVLTSLLPGRRDVLLLPPGSLYPYHWTRKEVERGLDHKTSQPWAFAAHHWRASWVRPREPEPSPSIMRRAIRKVRRLFSTNGATS